MRFVETRKCAKQQRKVGNQKEKKIVPFFFAPQWKVNKYDEILCIRFQKKSAENRLNSKRSNNIIHKISTHFFIKNE